MARRFARRAGPREHPSIVFHVVRRVHDGVKWSRLPLAKIPQCFPAKQLRGPNLISLGGDDSLLSSEEGACQIWSGLCSMDAATVLLPDGRAADQQPDFSFTTAASTGGARGCGAASGHGRVWKAPPPLGRRRVATAVLRSCASAEGVGGLLAGCLSCRMELECGVPAVF